MGKFGKRNTVSKNMTDYNICILGESGIGKTTIMVETCEKLVGDEGYILLNMGKEDGISCIEGAIYENCPTWKKFEEVLNDIIKNKATDYPDLKIIVIDTIDQLFDLAEPEVVRRYNSEKLGEKNFKPAKTINSAYGGFGAGLTEVERLVLDKIWSLKNVGITVWMCGHVKAKEVVDPVTDQSYNTLSSLLSQRYFNAIKTKMHIIGMAVIDRNVITESTGRKNIITKEDITKKKVVSEARKIYFRDDNYGVDSKSRFASIVDEIPLNSDELIKAVQDAIYKAGEARGGEITKTTKTPAKKTEEEPLGKPDDVFEDAPAEQAEEPDLDNEEENEEEILKALRNEVAALYKKADKNLKLQIKGIIADNSSDGKLGTTTKEGLLEIKELFE